MGRKSLSSQRRAEIIDNFCKVAEEQGVESTSLGQVAKKMDINVSLILHYFKSKEDLLIAVCEHIMQQYSRIFCDFDKLTVVNKQLLKDLVDTLFSRSWNTLVDDSLFYGFYSMVYRYPVIKEAYRKIHRSLHDQLKEILDKANANGVISIENSFETAVDIFTILDGWYYQMGMIDDEVFAEKRMESSKAMVYRLLNFN